MSQIVLLPILIPLFVAAVQIIAWRSIRFQRLLAVAGAVALLAAALALLATVRRSGYVVAHVGDWPAPYGITIVADLFSAMMVTLAAIMSLAAVIYSLGSIDLRSATFGYFPLLNLLLMGVCGAFLTGDIFNLYVWFEVMLLASFVLLTLGGKRAQILGGIQYVTLNLLSSAIFLAAAGLLYGAAGTLNMADLALKLRVAPNPGFITVLSLLFLVAFGIKAAVFPLFFWLPASYHTPPVAVSAIFSGLLTKVGVYALIRVFTLVFTHDPDYTHTLILVIGGLTMVTGVLGAVAQYEFRRLLSFHIISQIGYLLMGLGLFSVASLAGAIFFLAHVILSKAALFFVSGIAQARLGTFELKQMGGLYRSAPGLALLFLLPALSLAGIPPLSGFFAKLALIQAGLGAGNYSIVAVALGVSVLTLFSMIKIWNEAFWKPLPAGVAGERGTTPNPELPDAPQAAVVLRSTPLHPGAAVERAAPVIGLAALIVLLGLLAEPMFTLASAAAAQLIDPAGYIRAVLGG